MVANSHGGDREAAYGSLRVAANRVVSALLNNGEDASLVADIRAVRAFQARLWVEDAATLESAVTWLDRVAGLVETDGRVDVPAELGHPKDLPTDEIVAYDTMRQAGSRLAGWYAAGARTDDEAVRNVRDVWDAVRAVDIHDDDAILLAGEQFEKRLRDVEGPHADEAVEEFLASEAISSAREKVRRLLSALSEDVVAEIAGDGDRHPPEAWRDSLAAPTAAQTERMTVALGAYDQLEGTRGVDAARAWFTTTNPALGGVTPANALALDRYADVRSAAAEASGDGL